MIIEEDQVERCMARPLKRKIFHIVLGCFFLLMMLIGGPMKHIFLGILLIGTIVSFVQSRIKLPLITWFLDRFDREGDEIPGQGIITFFAGVLLVWYLFPVDVAFISVLVLAIGDPNASMVGIAFGDHPMPWCSDKSLEGTFAFLAVTAVVVMIFYNPLMGLVCGVIGALLESLPFWNGMLLDDNISVTALLALIIWLLTLVYPPII
ncbi:MAG: diacylglycerol/polyprenol kinase family protein [Thermoplasmatota archaeon]